MTILFAALLALAATPVHAEFAAASCHQLGGIGCYFVPDDAPQDATLLIYLRGHHPVYKSRVPASECLASARQAFLFYGLGRLAEEKKMAVLVTCRSGQAVTENNLAALAQEAGKPFAKRIIAAHSGGYVGLGATLDAGVNTSRILMLDDFYDGSPDGLNKKVQKAVAAGATCAGYFTPHNKKRYETAYKPVVSCAMDELKDNALHDPTVARCLGPYLTGACAL
ncbi:MAG: hypothetical protein ACHQ51_13445 [Elusimicrobiota bacterium]